MFSYKSTVAFCVRLAIFMLLFSAYPIINLFLRTHLLNIFFKRRDVSQMDMVMLNIIVTTIPLSFSLFYPEIATILAFSGAFGGFISIYCLPVLVHLKKQYVMIKNPILAEAMALNDYRYRLNKG